MTYNPARLDFSTRAGAELLAQRVREHWRCNGVEVTVWVEAAEVPARHGTERVYVVKSDMRGGLPAPVRTARRREAVP